MAKFENFAGKLLRLEGGYVNHALDKGGPTKYGVILSDVARNMGMTKMAMAILMQKTSRSSQKKMHDISPRKYSGITSWLTIFPMNRWPSLSWIGVTTLEERPWLRSFSDWSM
jgi:hypothetical protein